MDETLLNKALWYAEKKQWYVFPCRIRPSQPFLLPNGKEKILPAKSPLYKGGLNNATLDKKQIIEWWKKTPQAAIGINCGLSNLTVVDVDMHKENVDGFGNWMSLNVPDEGALHASTPSNGLHIIYAGLNDSYGDENVGVDVRSRGTYFCAPPSYVLLKKGNGEYGKYKELDDWSREPIQAPSDLMNKLDVLRGKNKKENKRRELNIDSLDQEVLKAKKALQRLPSEYCEEHNKWVAVGLSLYCLGDAGLHLWKEWSKSSDKYDEDDLEYRWSKFQPRKIGLGSLLFWAYGKSNANQS